MGGYAARVRMLAVVIATLGLLGAGCGGEPARTGADALDFRRAPAERDGPDVAVAVEQAIVDHLADDGSNEDELLAAATRGQRAVYALEVMDGEVNNGGFAQFFTNSSGSLTREAITGAALVGARRHERVIRDAAAVFPRGRVRVDFEARNDAFDRLPASADRVLRRLGDRSYALDLELNRTLRTYIRAHAAQFFRPR